MGLKLSRYPLRADGNPMDVEVGVLTDASGNSGAPFLNNVLGPDGAPIDAKALILVDTSGNPIAISLTDNLVLGTFTSMTNPLLVIPSTQDSLETSGYAAKGDGGRARYAYDPAVDNSYVAAHPGASFIAANGRGYRLDERRPIPHMFTGGGNTGFLNAQSWADFKGLKMPFLYQVTEALAPGTWSLPADFNDQLGVKRVVFDGSKWYFENNPITKIDCTRIPLAYTTFYHSYATGLDTNNGTAVGTPFKTWIKVNSAVAALAAGSNVLVVCLDQNVGYLSWIGATNGFSGRNVKVVSQHASGFTRFVGMREDKNLAAFAWVAHGTHGAWKTSGVFGGSGFINGNFGAQFWLGQTDVDGFPIPVVSTGQSAATVDTTELTSFWDGTTLYVHLPNGAQPDPFNNWLYSNGTVFQINTDSGDLLFSGDIRFFNSGQGAPQNALRVRAIDNVTAISSARVGFDGCKFFGSAANGLGTFDIQVVVTRNCKAAYCLNDLFNTHSFRLTAANGAAITYYEENNSGHHAGYTGFNLGIAAGLSDNGSTGHDGMSAVLVGSQFRDVDDSCFAYVGGSDTLLYGCKAPINQGASRGDYTSYKGAFVYDANTGEGTRRRFWMIGCTGAYDGLAPAIQIAGTAVDAEIRIEKWQGDPHARLYARTANTAGPGGDNSGIAGGAIKAMDGTMLFKAA